MGVFIVVNAIIVVVDEQDEQRRGFLFSSSKE